MAFEAQREQALAILEKTGIWKSNYAPPILRLLWRLGIKARPPHFASFLAIAIFSGMYFSIAWGLFMWFTSWSHQGIAILSEIYSSAIAGVIFGVALASYYAYGRWKHKLPKWNSLGNE